MISAFIFFDKTYLQKPHCVTIENISSNKKKLQLRFVLKNKDLKGKVRRINLKLTLLYQLKQILDELLIILHRGYQLIQLYFFLICTGDSAGAGYRPHIMPRSV